jgi:hypothetical protein
MYGMEQWAQGTSSFFIAHYKLVNVVTGLTVVLALTINLFRGRLHLNAYPLVGWVCLGLYAFAGLTFLWTDYRIGWSVRMSIQFPYVLTVLVLMPLLIYDIRDLRTGMYYMLGVGSVLVVLLALTVEWSHRSIELQGSVGEGAANPLAVASMGAYVCILAALMNFKGVGRLWQILRWPIMGFGLYLPLVSGSRGQLMAAIFVILLFLPISRRITNVKGFFGTVVAVAVVGAIAVAAYMQFATDKRWNIEEMMDAYSQSRIEWSILLLKTWLGKGPIVWFLGMGNSVSFAPWLIGIYPHIVAVEVLCEEGLIGFFLLTLAVVLTIKNSREIYPYLRDNPDMRGVFAAMMALCLFEFILTFKQGSLLGNTSTFAFMIILGRLAMYFRRTGGAAVA